jgi:hypothetical protein
VISSAAVALVRAGADALRGGSGGDHALFSSVLEGLEVEQLRAAVETLVLLVVVGREELAEQRLYVDETDDEWLARLGMRAAEDAAWA